MLGDRRLAETERRHDVADGMLSCREIFEDLAPPWFGDGIEGVRRGGRSRHTAIIFLCGNMSSTASGVGNQSVERQERRLLPPDLVESRLQRQTGELLEGQTCE